MTLQIGRRALLILLAILFVRTSPADAREGDGVPPVESGKPVLRVEPTVLQPNVLPNASFEEVEAGRPKSWLWDRRNTDAVLTIDDSVAHSGRVHE